MEPVEFGELGILIGVVVDGVRWPTEIGRGFFLILSFNLRSIVNLNFNLDAGLSKCKLFAD